LPPATIRVLVVDDSALIRQMLTRALAMDPRIEVVATAKTGVDAIEKAKDYQPDVITLDIEMPELTGLEALPHIRKHTSARVVMLSSLDDPDTTYRALSLGAVDFLAKPHQGMASSLSELADVLIKKIKTANRITPDQVVRVQSAVAERVAVEKPPAEDAAPPVSPSAGEAHKREVVPAERLVAIAASTGGPPALERVFQGLQSSMHAAYLIVQHLPPGFSASLAKRLASAGEVEVREAFDGAPLSQGVAYVAPSGRHMVVREDAASGERVVGFTEDPPMHGVRPAADPLFESVARTYGEKAVAVVLTGMGSDGALGAARIRDAGGQTVVQDESTSVVWGMPGAVTRLGVADHTVPLGLVAVEIRRVLRGAGGDA
jgi:two-component system chemotaxis response regulator CheB